MESRKQRILHAVIKEYVSTAVPVGSKTLCDNYDLDCSPATVRSELAALEEQGYLTHPHTSAGRVPTDRGYRLFVDNIVSMRDALKAGQLPVFIDEDALKTLDSSDVIRIVSKALSAYTRCVALSKTPSLDNVTVKKLELLSLSERRILFVLVTSGGQVFNRTIELLHPATPEQLADISHSLNIALDGKPAHDVRPLRDALAQKDSSLMAVDELMVVILDEILDVLKEADHEQVQHGGVAALLTQPEFAQTERVSGLVDALESGLDIVELINDFKQPISDTLHIRIGNENTLSAFGDTSLVVSSFQRDGGLGFIGVVGPTRMNYLRSINAVLTAAAQLSDATLSDETHYTQTF